MKNLIYVVLVITISFGFASCGIKSKKELAKKAQQKEDSLKKAGEQLVFESVLYPYSEDTTEFLEELFSKEYLALVKTKGTLVKITSGDSLEIGLAGNTFSGKLPRTIYALKIKDKFFTKEGIILNAEKFKYSPVFDFEIVPLKSHWTRRELSPLLEKYELSVRAKETFGNILVLDWEDFRDNFEHVLEYELDPKGCCLVKIGKEQIIISQEGKCWLTRKESLARRNFCKILPF